ncbi:uncharacterized protein TNCV_21011 [Trichonephila clavipes]|uniref:Uncharacterized protein n=1 Tax=Trichonephila clavipes TaxID=2585209 RepID=A0A8X6REZ8_TRICX|nr:uncharacterized protein TNCV_21011 [Trichonephila clavipes]
MQKKIKQGSKIYEKCSLQCHDLKEQKITFSLARAELAQAKCSRCDPGGHHSGAQRVNPEFRVGSNFQIIPEQYFSGVENVVEVLENMDNNLTYYEIPTQLACAYLMGHLTGRALVWLEILGYRVVKDKATDYAPFKQALSEQFPVVRNPLTTSNLLQIIDKYEERFLNRKIRVSSWESRDIQPNENNRFSNRNLQENWRETRGNNRYVDNSRPRREFNRFESQGVVDNQRLDGDSPRWSIGS